MDKKQFTTRTLTLVSMYTYLNTDYSVPFLEASLAFVDDDNNDFAYGFPLATTPTARSEYENFKNLFELSECKRSSDMIGKKFIGLRISNDDLSDDNPLAFVGLGSYSSDKFIELYPIYSIGIIFTRNELEKILEKKLS